jgi:tRNA (cytidine/uridine-2'-O-)-methyltransferase
MAKYEPQLHVVLHHPEIPQNTGNVGRTCVAIGAKLWLVRPLGFRIDAKNLRRAGLDYWKYLEWEVVDHWSVLAEAFANHRVWYFTKTATRIYTSVEYERGDVFVFGSESNGLPATLLREKSDSTLLIPIRPEVRSLNLSNSVAIAVYEAQRQWGFPKC